jgi:mono/diheme cytochrome c family protein
LRRVPALLLCLAAALGGCGGGAKPIVADTPGARLYLSTCSACHRGDGSGIDGLQPPLAGTPVAVGDPATLLAWVMYGRRPAALPRGAYAGVMPQFAYLADDDLAALLSYVRSSFGNRAPPVTAAMVAAARAAHRG